MSDKTLPRLLTEKSRLALNKRQRFIYREWREDFVEWLLYLGKSPEQGRGYARETVINTAGRTDRFNRWVWEQYGFTLEIGHNHGDEYVQHLVRRDISDSAKSKDLKALKRYYKWREYEHGEDYWDPPVTFYDGEGRTDHPKDYLSKAERGKIREAALEYGSVPSYHSVGPERRARIKEYLSQRFSKDIRDIGPGDWERANGWKWPSLVWVSLDAGLRPKEVERSTLRWVDIDNGVLRVPKEGSAKGGGAEWVVPLRSQTARALERWLMEREAYPLYDGRDELWLTRFGNPYGREALRRVMHKLCDLAEIDYTHRTMTWYAMRHSTATYMAREEGLAAAQAQLRHKDKRTTMRYDQAPVEDRQKALERMG